MIYIILLFIALYTILGRLRIIKVFREWYSDSESTTVPKIIFQTWKTGVEMPPHFKKGQESVQQMNPDWKYVLFDDDDNRNFVVKHFPDFLETYDTFPYTIQRVDAIRYMYLYVYGGIYLDLDFIANRSFDTIDLGDKEVGLVYSSNIQNVVTNAFMVSKPKSSFWLACIDEMKNPKPIWAVGKHWEVMTTTGPLMVNRVYKKRKDKVYILPDIYPKCNVCTIQENKCTAQSNHYLIPIVGNSWHSADSTFYNHMYCNVRSHFSTKTKN